MSHPEPHQIAALRGDRSHEEAADIANVTPKQWALWEVGLKPMPVRLWEKLSKPPADDHCEPNLQALTTSTVKALRLAYGCKRYQIAQFVGVHPDTWGKWEKTCPPSPRKWGRVLEALEGQPKHNPELSMESKTEVAAQLAEPFRIKMYREAALMTRAQAAALIDVKERTWKSWELGDRPMKQSLLDEWAAKATAIGNAPAPNPAAYVAPEMPRPLYFRPQGDVHVTVPGAIVITDDMTPEQEAEMERDLATPVMYDPRNPKSVQDALKAELGDQDALRKAAYERTMELVARDQKRLEED